MWFQYRWFALVYILAAYFLVPGIILGLSFLPIVSRYITIGSMFLVLFIIIVISVLQERCPTILPRILRSWNFLPTWLHSLKPYDKFMTKFVFYLPFGKKIFRKANDNISVYELQVDPQIQKFFQLALHTTV